MSIVVIGAAFVDIKGFSFGQYIPDGRNAGRIQYVHGGKGCCPAEKVAVVDTTGAGDAFCAGVACGLTCGRSLSESVGLGSRFAASVIASTENVCPASIKEALRL